MQGYNGEMRDGDDCISTAEAAKLASKLDETYLSSLPFAWAG